MGDRNTHTHTHTLLRRRMRARTTSSCPGLNQHQGAHRLPFVRTHVTLNAKISPRNYLLDGMTRWMEKTTQTHTKSRSSKHRGLSPISLPPSDTLGHHPVDCRQPNAAPPLLLPPFYDRCQTLVFVHKERTAHAKRQLLPRRSAPSSSLTNHQSQSKDNGRY